MSDLFQSVKYLEWLYLHTDVDVSEKLVLARLDWVTLG